MIIRVSLKEPSSVTNGTEEILLLVTKEILLLAKFKSSYFSRQQVTPFVKMNFRMTNSVNQKSNDPQMFLLEFFINMVICKNALKLIHKNYLHIRY